MTTVASSASAISRARTSENVAVGDLVIRHRLASRRIHWTVAVLFFVSLFSGLPIWTPVFGWLAGPFGGLHVCRWLHPWAGTLFVVATAVMFFHWLGDMRLEPADKEWLGPKALSYMRNEGDTEDVGKYNGGQKLFFYAVGLGALGLLASGTLLWFPTSVAEPLRLLSFLLHDVVFILFAIAIVLHIYLGTAATPGTFASMTRGTVSKAWARHHHPRWYREVTGEDSHRR
jgi:formate dehydrogenase subunit gamma